MISKNNLKYLLKIRKRIKSFKNNHTIEMHKSKIKSLLDRYMKKDLLFFEIKIYFKEIDLEINPDLKIYRIVGECNEKIIKKIKLMEFIYVNGEIKNKNNLYVRLLIGVKSIIGYNKLLLKKYKNIFRSNKNIEIKYLPNNKKIQKTINKVLKLKDPTRQVFMYKNRVYIHDLFGRENIIPDMSNYNDFIPKISFENLWFSERQLKLDNQFNNQYIISNKKIFVFSLINIWKTYCIINDIYYSNNKLYKKFIFYRDKKREENKIEPIKIKIKDKLILIDNKKGLQFFDNSVDGIEVKYIYIGELDYFVKNINFIMRFMLECYPQQMNKALLKKIKKKYLKKAFKLINIMPNLYLMECELPQ